MCLGPLGELLLVVFRLIDGILDASQAEPPLLCLVGRRKPCREVTKRRPQTQQRGPMGDLPFVALCYGAVLAAGPPALDDKLFGLRPPSNRRRALRSTAGVRCLRLAHCQGSGVLSVWPSGRSRSVVVTALSKAVGSTRSGGTLTGVQQRPRRIGVGIDRCKLRHILVVDALGNRDICPPRRRCDWQSVTRAALGSRGWAARRRLGDQCEAPAFRALQSQPAAGLVPIAD